MYPILSNPVYYDLLACVACKTKDGKRPDHDETSFVAFVKERSAKLQESSSDGSLPAKRQELLLKFSIINSLVIQDQTSK
jgi:hypothetical protein